MSPELTAAIAKAHFLWSMRYESASPARPNFRQWVDDQHSISFRLWEDGTVEYAIRTAPTKPWGEWILLSEIKVREATVGD